MDKKKITAITIETKRLMTIRSGRRKTLRGWCGPCHANRHLLTVEYAAFLSCLSLRQVFQHIENGRLHFSESSAGPRVCLDSLCELVPQTKKQVLGLME
jgi:hypothetical protein